MANFKPLLAIAGLVLVAATPTREPPDDPLLGHWALTTGQTALMTLDLRRSGAPDGTIAGSFDEPRHWQSSRNGVFTSVSGPTIEKRVAAADRSGNALDLSLVGADAHDVDHVVFQSTGPDTATLSYREMPGLRFSFRRVPASVHVGSDWDSERSYLPDDGIVSNPEMTRLFDADQADRVARPIDWSKVDPRDRERRSRTKDLLAAGMLHTGADFEHAAFVFQHGSLPDDYLMAHTLALVAVARGRASASWIAAATLDRYLQTIGRDQIYGTQYRHESGSPVTQDPYDRILIPDALRSELGVPTIAEQTLPENMPAGAQPSSAVPASTSPSAAGRSK